MTEMPPSLPRRPVPVVAVQVLCLLVTVLIGTIAVRLHLRISADESLTTAALVKPLLLLWGTVGLTAGTFVLLWIRHSAGKFTGLCFIVLFAWFLFTFNWKLDSADVERDQAVQVTPDYFGWYKIPMTAGFVFWAYLFAFSPSAQAFFRSTDDTGRIPK